MTTIKRRGQRPSTPVQICKDCYAAIPAASHCCPHCGCLTHAAERKIVRKLETELAKEKFDE